MRYVILGSSASGISAGRQLRAQDSAADITMITMDDTIYSRCILHHYLGNIRTIPQLNFAEEDYFAQFRITKICDEAVGLGADKKCVRTRNSGEIPYDKLLIATGAHSAVPPIPNLDGAQNVVGFRNLDDVTRIKAHCEVGENIVIVGAGLVGIDCACGLVDLGKRATIVEMAPHLLAKQLDGRSASRYQSALTERGICQHYGVGVEKVIRQGDAITHVVLTDGQEIPCDLLVITVGVRSNVAFLKDSGVEVDRFGLVFDDYGQTNVADIYGAGDVSGRTPIWPMAVKQGIVAANNMTGRADRLTDFFASKATMNFLGIPTMSLGVVNGYDDSHHVASMDCDDVYKKIIHKDGEITGAVLQGDLAYSGVLQQLIAHRIDVSRLKKSIFDIDYSDFFHVNENFEFFYSNDKEDDVC